MHFYFMTRGINQQVELFKMMAQSQMFRWERENIETGNKEVCQVQGSLRPVQLWEYIFPEECLEEVLTMFHVNESSVDGCARRTKGHNYGVSDFKLMMLRKLLGKGIEPVPDYTPVITNKFVEQRGIALYPIGIKKDVRGELMGYKQEML